MYQSYPAWVTAFHGCDQTVFEKVLYSHVCLTQSNNDYDWLGHGIYFWENNPLRAYEFAMEQKARGKIIRPAVIGAMINLGNCLDFTDMISLSLVKKIYLYFEDTLNARGLKIPRNTGRATDSDKSLRKLDCAVIQFMHEYMRNNKLNSFDSVRCAFFEGAQLYPGAGFSEKGHIQLCIINPDCIKGFFAPRIDVKSQYEATLAH